MIFTFVMGLMHVANIMLGLLFVSLVVTKYGYIKSCIKDIKFWCLLTAFILTIVGLLHSADLTEGLKYVEYRLSLLILPLPMYLLRLSKKELNTTLLSFVVSCSIAAVVGIISAMINYFETSDSGYFYNDFLVYPVNNQAVYFSIYINTAIIFLVYLWQSNYITAFKHKALVIITIIFFLTFNFMLASRLSIIIIYIFGFGYLIYWAYTKNKLKVGITIAASLVIILLVLINFMPKTLKRFRSVTNTSFSFDNMKAENHFNKEISEENWNGLTLRLAIWSCAWEVVKDNPIVGIGTGDYPKALFDSYEKKGFKYGIQKSYGSHNQYMYFLLITGSMGLILFLASLTYPIWYAWRDGNYLYVIVTLLIMMAFLTENFLNRYIGIFFFALIQGMLLFNPSDKS